MELCFNTVNYFHKKLHFLHILQGPESTFANMENHHYKHRVLTRAFLGPVMVPSQLNSPKYFPNWVHARNNLFVFLIYVKFLYIDNAFWHIHYLLLFISIMLNSVLFCSITCIETVCFHYETGYYMFFFSLFFNSLSRKHSKGKNVWIKVVFILYKLKKKLSGKKWKSSMFL